MRKSHAMKLLVASVMLQIVSVSGAVKADTSIKPGDQATQYFKVPPRDGEFRKAFSPGIQGIACTTVSPPGSSAPTEFSYNNCLKLGSLQLGMEFYRLQIALANLKSIPEPFITNPRLVNKSPEGINTLLIPIAATQAGDQIRMQSYLVVLMDSSGIVKSLQLTGLPGDVVNKLHFSSITLGMSKESVSEILGFPSSVSNVPEISGKMWSYFPFPFTIEFKNDAVYSVRIDTPDKNNFGKVFVPLQAMPN